MIDVPPQQTTYQLGRTIRDELRDLRKRLEAHKNKPDRDWMISKCIRVLDELAELYEASGQKKWKLEDDLLDNFTEKCFLCQQAHMMQYIYKNSPPETLFDDPCIFVEGSFKRAFTTVSKKPTATDRLFEKFMASFLSNRGCRVLSHPKEKRKKVDIVFCVEGHRFAAECKRPRNRHGIRERIESAKSQLKTFADYNHLVVLDCTMPVVEHIKLIINKPHPEFQYTAELIWEQLGSIFEDEIPRDTGSNFLLAAVVSYFKNLPWPTFSVQMLPTGAESTPALLALGEAIKTEE